MYNFFSISGQSVKANGCYFLKSSAPPPPVLIRLYLEALALSTSVRIFTTGSFSRERFHKYVYQLVTFGIEKDLQIKHVGIGFFAKYPLDIGKALGNLRSALHQSIAHQVEAMPVIPIVDSLRGR